MSYEGEGGRGRLFIHHRKGSDAMRREEASFDRIYQKQYTAILSFAVSRGRSRADAEENTHKVKIGSRDKPRNETAAAKHCNDRKHLEER